MCPRECGEKPWRRKDSDWEDINPQIRHTVKHVSRGDSPGAITTIISVAQYPHTIPGWCWWFCRSGLSCPPPPSRALFNLATFRYSIWIMWTEECIYDGSWTIPIPCYVWMDVGPHSSPFVRPGPSCIVSNWADTHTHSMPRTSSVQEEISFPTHPEKPKRNSRAGGQSSSKCLHDNFFYSVYCTFRVWSILNPTTWSAPDIPKVLARFSTRLGLAMQI